jgi:hypothetical protein
MRVRASKTPQAMDKSACGGKILPCVMDTVRDAMRQEPGASNSGT